MLREKSLQLRLFVCAVTICTATSRDEAFFEWAEGGRVIISLSPPEEDLGRGAGLSRSGHEGTTGGRWHFDYEGTLLIIEDFVCGRTLFPGGLVTRA